MFNSVKIADQVIPVRALNPTISAEEVAEVIAFKPFKDWVFELQKQQEKSNNEIDFKSITIHAINRFRSRVGFVNLEAEAYSKKLDRMKFPGFVFMRGGAVSILIVLRCEGEKDKTILTLQSRLPVPDLDFPELPAGMLDGSGDFAGIAADEIRQEVGITIHRDELVDLTQLTYDDRYRGVYPSAGGSDEFLRLFVCIKHLEKSKIDELEGKLTGLRKEGEAITLKVVPLEDVWRYSPDAKLLSSLYLYQQLKDEIESNPTQQKSLITYFRSLWGAWRLNKERGGTKITKATENPKTQNK